MMIEVLKDESAAAHRAAAIIAEKARAAIAARGRFVVAVSGGRSPWLMLRDLAAEDLPWERVHLVQVDERVAPAGDPDRNLTHLRESVLALKPSAINLYPMPVEGADLETAAAEYTRTLETIAGSPPVLDVCHLGLGPDGHTASLVPGDPVLEVCTRDVALTGIYQGRRRMTLTYSIINRARHVLWLVTGNEKAAPLARLLNGDVSIPAGRVNSHQAWVVSDSNAAGQLGLR